MLAVGLTLPVVLDAGMILTVLTLLEVLNVGMIFSWCLLLD